MKNEPKLTQRAVKALEAGATADTLTELRAELSARQGEVSRRLQDIGEPTPGYPGAERRAAIATGDFDLLVELDAECRRLESEQSALAHLQDRVSRALVVAKAEEAAKGMPDQYKALGKLLDAESVALAALRKAQAATDRGLGEIRAGRQAINMAHNTGAASVKAPAGNPDTLNHYLDLRGISFDPMHGYGRDSHKVQSVADDLGLEMTRPAETMPAAAWL